VTVYAHPGPERIPGRKRCKTKYSPKIPARCKLARGHEGDCRFGVWRTGVQAIYLDQPLPKLATRRSTDPEDETP
jgi:hypothetical protein